MSIFINREEELSALEAKYKSNKAEFIIMYGRRRVGKTELIKQFCIGKKHTYYLSTKSNDLEQMKLIVKRISDSLNDRTPEINSWNEFFQYLQDKSKNERIVLAIDEYPYLLSANSAISSIFQAGWDEYLKKTKVFLILCGSSISVMESELSSKSPLYGRRTGQIRVEPFLFKDSIKFFPNYDIFNKIYSYGILGNVPLYLMEFSDKKNILSNIADSLLKKDSILYEEPIFLLREELREPELYSKIFEAISEKGAKMVDISAKTKIDQHKLPKYLGVLKKLNYIDVLTPVTIKKPKSKQTLYVIKDNFFKFWYKYVYPNKSEIEGGDKEKVIAIIKSQLDQYTSFIFEDICKQWFKELNRKNKLPIYFNKVGTWWGHTRILSDSGSERKELEIDIVCLDENKQEALFTECKWSNINYGEAKKVLEALKEKSKFVDWTRKKEYFCIVAKEIKDKKKLRKEGFLAFDLEDFD
ncbi:MAG: ATP-binding protein [Nanoarchaeota archaeon]